MENYNDAEYLAALAASNEKDKSGIIKIDKNNNNNMIEDLDHDFNYYFAKILELWPDYQLVQTGGIY